MAPFVTSLTGTVTLAADAIVAELTPVGTIGDALALDALFAGAAAVRLLSGVPVALDAAAA